MDKIMERVLKTNFRYYYISPGRNATWKRHPHSTKLIKLLVNNAFLLNVQINFLFF